jgi:hypothetical protein
VAEGRNVGADPRQAPVACAATGRPQAKTVGGHRRQPER